jgi:hypothetical protein
VGPPDGPRTVDLTDDERAMLRGESSRATALAMLIVVKMAEVAGAQRLVPVTSAHIDGCLYHGPVGLDFAERLVGDGGRVAVPSTLNVSALDLLHPELVRLNADTSARARRLMDAYVELGCEPTWTCAPYQLPSRPRAGEHVAWAESNAVVFANSVLGARTARYGDFVDICAALTGRVPLAGVHLDDGRRAQVVFRFDPRLLDRFARRRPTDELFGLVGHIIGRRAGARVAVTDGLPLDTTEDELKALGAAAASSGAVALCHVVGVTPEAATLDAACHGRAPEEEVLIGPADLAMTWRELSTAPADAQLAAVSVGTPHFSAAEFATLTELLAGRSVDPRVHFYVSSGRSVLSEITAAGLTAELERAGATIVADTCTYITPIIGTARGGVVMTNSAKWAWYGPANLGVEVVYGSLADCVESAVHGKVLRAPPDYLDG